jgi:hypothetical protein
MSKPKGNTLGIFGMIGFVTILLIFGLSTNGAVYSEQEQTFTTSLTGSKGIPPIMTPATGTANFTLSADGKSLNFVLTLRNIHSAIGADIHSGNGRQNGPVVLILFGNPITSGPIETVNGILFKGARTASDLQGPLAGKALSDLVNLIKSGNAYVNYTTQNPKGEIRGQITAGS